MRTKLAFFYIESESGAIVETTGSDGVMALDGRWNTSTIYAHVVAQWSRMKQFGKKYTHYRVGRFTNGGMVNWETPIIKI